MGPAGISLRSIFCYGQIPCSLLMLSSFDWAVTLAPGSRAGVRGGASGASCPGTWAMARAGPSAGSSFASLRASSGGNNAGLTVELRAAGTPTGMPGGDTGVSAP